MQLKEHLIELSPSIGSDLGGPQSSIYWSGWSTTPTYGARCGRESCVTPS